MELTYLRRRCRVVWHGKPFESLEPFTINVATMLNAGAHGSPIMTPSNQWMLDDQIPDLAIGYGNVGIEEFGEGSIWAGAGPILVHGKNGGPAYEVSFASFTNRILAEEEEIEILARWRVTATV